MAGLPYNKNGVGMIRRLPADRRDNLIRVELGRGCYLLLTWAEYTAGIERGKREKRSLLTYRQQGKEKP